MAIRKAAAQDDGRDGGNVGTPLDAAEVEALLEELAGANRRRRQDASHRLALAAQDDPESMLPHVDALVDALFRPEAQTRWEALCALTAVAEGHADLVGEAYEGAEASLFDEDSAIVRLAAFRFLVRYGASGPARSDQVWPIVDEAIQCYHGDPEYRDMLVALAELARGQISDATRDALLARIGFDAENGRGYVRIMSSEILSAAKGE